MTFSSTSLLDPTASRLRKQPGGGQQTGTLASDMAQKESQICMKAFSQYSYILDAGDKAAHASSAAALGRQGLSRQLTA